MFSLSICSAGIYILGVLQEEKQKDKQSCEEFLP